MAALCVLTRMTSGVKTQMAHSELQERREREHGTVKRLLEIEVWAV